jgi:hypothetical protein
MELVLKRFFDSHDDTSGLLLINGKYFCFTLEDTFRHKKEAGITRIPAGKYEIKLRKGSPMADRYLKNYGTEGMLHLQDVPGFEYVYIHIGNTDEDSEGCILVGSMLRFDVKNGLNQLNQIVMNSREVYIELHDLIFSKIERNEVIYITIIDN